MKIDLILKNVLSLADSNQLVLTEFTQITVMGSLRDNDTTSITDFRQQKQTTNHW